MLFVKSPWGFFFAFYKTIVQIRNNFVLVRCSGEGGDDVRERGSKREREHGTAETLMHKIIANYN